MIFTLKFIYSEKATNHCEISTVDLSYVLTVKSTVEISKNFVAFSEYMNFKDKSSSEDVSFIDIVWSVKNIQHIDNQLTLNLKSAKTCYLEVWQYSHLHL